MIIKILSNNFHIQKYRTLGKLQEQAVKIQPKILIYFNYKEEISIPLVPEETGRTSVEEGKLD